MTNSGRSISQAQADASRARTIRGRRKSNPRRLRWTGATCANRTPSCAHTVRSSACINRNSHVNAPALAASSNLTRSFARRRIAPVLIVVSLLLALHDAAGYFRADLLIEAVARAGMAMVAAIIVYAWPSNARYEQQRTLLLWGVIGFSFDLFWQEAYAGSIQAAAMVLKYAGIACGL